LGPKPTAGRARLSVTTSGAKKAPISGRHERARNADPIEIVQPDIPNYHVIILFFLILEKNMNALSLSSILIGGAPLPNRTISESDG